MNTTQQGIILLLKSAITGEKFPLPEAFDLETALTEINRHKIHTLAFQGGVNCGIPRNHPAMQQLFQKYCHAMLVSEGQLRELQRIYKAFDENEIAYMPLKGCNMKYRYPQPELRLMGDADILIRMEQYERIVPIMESLGFIFKCESDHELIWQSRGLYLELHKHLIPSYQKDLSPYFLDCWERADLAAASRYVMSPEDEWLYLFTHFAKHFRDSGIGCRHVVDLWVFLRSHPDLQEDYIKGVLKELQLLEFHNNIRQLISVWFENGISDERTEVLTQCIFHSGSWGQVHASLASASIRNANKRFGKNTKLRYLWSYLFPDLENMQRRHRILEKMPWLLPVMWIVRLTYKVLFDRRDLKKKEQDLAVITEENVQARRELLRYIGLEYHME